MRYLQSKKWFRALHNFPELLPPEREDCPGRINPTGDTNDSGCRFEELINNITHYVPHELRTPLVAILGYSDLILDDFEDLPPDDIRSMIRRINIGAKRLHNTIEKFITYTEIECLSHDRQLIGDLSIYNIRNINEVIEVCIKENFSSSERYKDIIFKSESAGVKIANKYLEIALTELIANALKFSPAGSKIEITGAKKEEYYELSVKDSGFGMTESQIKRIGAFFQFERKRNQQTGNGLGLIIVKRIAGIFDCSLEIESIKGKGTMVNLKIPLDL